MQLREHLKWRPSVETYARVGIYLMCDGVQLALGVADNSPSLRTGWRQSSAQREGYTMLDVTLWVLNEESREVRPGEVGTIVVAKRAKITRSAGALLKIQERYSPTGAHSADLARVNERCLIHIITRAQGFVNAPRQSRARRIGGNRCNRHSGRDASEAVKTLFAPGAKNACSLEDRRNRPAPGYLSKLFVALSNLSKSTAEKL